MSIILTGPLATDLVRIHAITDERFDAESCTRILEEAYPSPKGVDAIKRSLQAGACGRFLQRRGLALAEELGSVNLPAFSVVAPKRRSVRAIEGVRTRYVTYPLAQETLLRVSPALGLGEETYVTAPALGWILEAARMDDANALVDAMERCGSYSVSSTSAMLSNLLPATTPAELSMRIAEIADAVGAQRVAGLARARAMVPFVLSGSASPMESKVAALVTLPVSRGGWGIRGLSLNRRIELTKEQREIAKRPYLVLDGYLPAARLAYEYDSRAFHAHDLSRDGGGDEYRDRVRVSAALCLDIKLLSLTTDIVMDEARCTAFCDEFARLAGKRQREASQRTLERRKALRKSLGLPVDERFFACDVEVPTEVYEAVGFGR